MKGTDANPSASVVQGEGVMGSEVLSSSPSAWVGGADAAKEVAATLRSVACWMVQLHLAAEMLQEGLEVTSTVLASEKVCFVKTLAMVVETRMGQQASKREGGHV